jgi:hypothetical protein
VKGRLPWSKRDIRRSWECPVCGRYVKTQGDVVNQPCDCLAKNDPSRLVWMRLVEQEPKREDGALTDR